MLLFDGSRPDEPVQDLVRRAKKGDRAAFEDLVRMYYRQIHRWAMGITRDPDDADDVVQEVLVRLERRIKTFAGKSRFSTWLFQVTRNTALGQQRKRTRRLNLLQGSRKAEVEEDAFKENQLQHLQTANVVDHVMASFELLPARQRQVFDLADLQGFNPAEIGEMLAMNPVTVRANLCKARRAIRAKVLEQFPEIAEGLHT